MIVRFCTLLSINEVVLMIKLLHVNERHSKTCVVGLIMFVGFYKGNLQNFRFGME